ncbi:MAG: DUF3021 domain-containing protein [Christensenellales bacterium]
MVKKIIKRGLFGFPIGIAIGFVISLIISVCFGDGYYYPVTPELISSTGNELNAVVLQTVLCGMLGSGFAMASIIWELESWSIVKQSGVYFMIACVIMFPVAYIANWMKHSVGGVLSYMGIFVLIFIIVWVAQYLGWKHRIKRMNDCVGKDREDREEK